MELSVSVAAVRSRRPFRRLHRSRRSGLLSGRMIRVPNSCGLKRRRHKDTSYFFIPNSSGDFFTSNSISLKR